MLEVTIEERDQLFKAARDFAKLANVRVSFTKYDDE